MVQNSFPIEETMSSQQPASAAAGASHSYPTTVTIGPESRPLTTAHRTVVQSILLQENTIFSTDGFCASCPLLHQVTLPDTLTTIPEETLLDCVNLTQINWPRHLQYIGNRAFENTGLVRVSLPDSVHNIYFRAFHGCNSLEYIRFPENEHLSLLLGNTCSNCPQLVEVEIPPGPRCLPPEAFASCRKLTTISIPDTVDYIRSGCFQWCKSLQSITLPRRLISIDDNAFFRADNLQIISITADWEEVPEHCFEGCPSLYRVSYPPGVYNHYSLFLTNGRNAEKGFFRKRAVLNKHDGVRCIGATVSSIFGDKNEETDVDVALWPYLLTDWYHPQTSASTIRSVTFDFLRDHIDDLCSFHDNQRQQHSKPPSVRKRKAL